MIKSINISFLTILFLFIFSFICYELGLYLFPSLDCLESPYLYITFHHNLQGVRKYSRNGCFIKNNVLHGNTKYINEARSVGISKYKGNNALYVCEAR